MCNVLNIKKKFVIRVLCTIVKLMKLSRLWCMLHIHDNSKFRVMAIYILGKLKGKISQIPFFQNMPLL